MTEDPEDWRKLVAQAKIGLEAVIDETTGFQHHRDPDALARRYRELGGNDEDYRAPGYPPVDGAQET